MAKTDLTAERLRELLIYDPDTGVFTWRASRRKASAGSTAGWIMSNGYLQIGVDWHKYLAHRLAWFHVHGAWPAADIDHRNGIRNDNRLENLREATRSFNLQNQRAPQKKGTSGFLGVSLDKRRSKWVAQIKASGVVHFLGYFETPEAAHAAYIAAKRERHPGCTI